MSDFTWNDDNGFLTARIGDREVYIDTTHKNANGYLCGITYENDNGCHPDPLIWCDRALTIEACKAAIIINL